MTSSKFNILVNHFKKAFEEVSQELVNSKFQICDSCNLTDKSKVAVIIGITGKSKGRILLESDMKTAKDFVVAMNCGDPLDDPKDLYLYMAEFANMFCGRSVTYINNEFKDREVWLTPPAIFSGEGLEIMTPSIKSETVYYTGKCGSFLIEAGFEGDN